MKTEKVVLSFIAVLVGLLVAGIAFFIYQSTKTIPASKLPKITINVPSPTITLPPPTVTLSIDQPTDESIVTTRSITINGKTNPDATIVVNTATDDQVTTPTANGTFSLTVNIDDGENEITITAINAKGEEITKKLTITYSTEEF
jgi:Glucodextranase, domain B